MLANLVHRGNLHRAMAGLSQGGGGGPLTPNAIAVPSTGATVLDVLRDKYPTPVEPPETVLLENDAAPVNDIVFEGVSAAGINWVAGSMKGSGGPSGLDVQAWQRMLSAFKGASSNLAAALAAAAKRIRTTDVDPASLSAFVAARLVALGKRPGVRPIAVGEVARRIIAKAVLQCISSDIATAVIPHQLCVGVPAACEAAVRARASRNDISPKTLVQSYSSMHLMPLTQSTGRPPCIISHVCVHRWKKTVVIHNYGADIPLFLLVA